MIIFMKYLDHTTLNATNGFAHRVHNLLLYAVVTQVSEGSVKFQKLLLIFI